MSDPKERLKILMDILKESTFAAMELHHRLADGKDRSPEMIALMSRVRQMSAAMGLIASCIMHADGEVADLEV